MEIKQLQPQEVKKLYDTQMRRDFPPSELRPYESIRMLTEQGHYVSFGFLQEEALGAYATFAISAETPKALLLDYFAVDVSRRGQGVGSHFLRALRTEARQFGAPWMLIEVESVETAQTLAQKEERERRIRFYAQCGCRASRVYSWLFGVEYRILYLPLAADLPPVDDGEIEAAMGRVYRTIVTPLAGPGKEDFSRVCRLYRIADGGRPDPLETAAGTKQGLGACTQPPPKA